MYRRLLRWRPYPRLGISDRLDKDRALVTSVPPSATPHGAQGMVVEGYTARSMATQYVVLPKPSRHVWYLHHFFPAQQMGRKPLERTSDSTCVARCCSGSEYLRVRIRILSSPSYVPDGHWQTTAWSSFNISTTHLQ